MVAGSCKSSSGPGCLAARAIKGSSAVAFTWFEIAVLTLGAVLGGFVNGLTGFGTALTAMPIWLQVMAPAPAAALGAASGVVGQLRTLRLIWGSIDWRVVGPFVVAGLIGVPIGTMALPLIEPRAFKLGVGVVLMAYCTFVLLSGRVRVLSLSPGLERLGDVLVGLAAGIMSGLAALSGPLTIVWATFKPWSRDQKRALFQGYNTVILAATLASSLLAGLLPGWFWTMALITLPGTLVGVGIGVALYRRLDDRRFDRLVLGVLLAMGVSLMVTNV